MAKFNIAINGEDIVLGNVDGQEEKVYFVKIHLNEDNYQINKYYLNALDVFYLSDEEYSVESDYYMLLNELIDEKVIISSLNSYFSNIVELWVCDEKYLALPIDEDIFEINANSRAINIPASFKKNGVGVEGDDTAETIYFIIDRYFDNTDLAAEDVDIIIQYQPVGGADALTSELIRDYETARNKLIFGWVIDKSVTQKPGTVKFSIRFVKKDAAGNIIYNLGTLASQITINKGLNLDISNFNADESVSKVSDLIRRRLINSTPEEYTKAEEPIVIYNIVEGEKKHALIDLSDVSEKDYTNIILGHENDGEKYQGFTALAVSKDSGYISYKWLRDEEEIKDNVKFAFIPVEKKNVDYNKGILYYYYDVDKDDYKKLSESEFKDFEGNVLYERRSTCLVDKVGKYRVVITNTVGTDSNSINNTEVYVEIPGPGEIQEIKLNEDLNISVENINEKEYKVVHLPMATLEDGEAAGVTLDIESIKGHEAIPGTPDNVICVWTKVPGVEENEKNPPVEIPREDWEPLEDVDENNKDIQVTETGWYTPIIISERNNARKENLSNIYYRVTSMPSVVDFLPNEEDSINLENNGSITMELDRDTIKNSDEIRIQWWKDNALENVFDKNDEQIEINGINEWVVTPNEQGQYIASLSNAELKALNSYGWVIYCVAHNIYNGQLTEAYSTTINIKNLGIPEEEEEIIE